MQYYDEISEGYEELHKEEQLKKIKIIKENATFNKNETVLDIGCGPYFADFEAKVTGIDPSIELLKKARIPTVVGAAEKLPFKDKSFDTAISITAIQNFNDIEKAISEIKRVARKRVIISFLKKSPKADTIKKLLEKNFAVEKIIEENKDWIYFMRVL